MPDLFEQLAQSEVPPPPVEFDRQLHERVNRSLLAMHVADLLIGAMPWAILQLLSALGGFLRLTISGSFGPQTKRNKGS
jgi:hypothetical protein